MKSLKSETDDGLSSWSNFPEKLTLEEMEMDKPVLLEIEHLRGKVTDEQLEAIKDVRERNEEVFLRHKADIGCCDFNEHKIELEETAVPHREGTRRMTPHKSVLGQFHQPSRRTIRPLFVLIPESGRVSGRNSNSILTNL